MFKKVADFGIFAEMLHIANFSSEFLIHVSAQNLTGVRGLKKTLRGSCGYQEGAHQKSHLERAALICGPAFRTQIIAAQDELF